MKKTIRDRITAAQRHGGGTASGTPTRGGRAVTACSVCTLPNRERQRVDRELIEETASLGAIAARIGCSKSSVKRHLDRHVRPAVTAEIQRIENREEIAAQSADEAPQRTGERPDIRKGVRPVVERLYEKCAEWADKAKDDESWPMFVACVREARQAAELVGRLNGELGRDNQGVHMAVQIVLPSCEIKMDDAEIVPIGRQR